MKEGKVHKHMHESSRQKNAAVYITFFFRYLSIAKFATLLINLMFR